MNICVSSCHIKNFFFKFKCVHDIKFTNFANNEIINLTTFEKKMFIYGLNKKLKIAREIGFVFFQIVNSAIKFFSNLSIKFGC